MNLVGLSSETHRDLKLQRTTSYGHARDAHAASLATAELIRAAMTYPVLFASNDGACHPVALLSLVQHENQYLDGDIWRAGYIPAVARAYPFRLAGEQVLVDSEAASLGVDEGEELFTEMGYPTTVLHERIEFLRACHAAEIETQGWCKRLSELGLLSERRAEVVSPRGTRYRVEGFFMVDTEKLATLEDASLAELARDGSLALIHAHLASLEHLVVLADHRDQLDAGKGIGKTDIQDSVPPGEKQASERAVSNKKTLDREV